MKKLGLKKKIKKILRSPKLLLISATILVLSATLLFANKGIWRHVALRTEVSKLAEHDAVLSKDEARLKSRVELLQAEDINFTERIAREKYHMKRPGEIIYREEETK
jgi:cell division protein FtsB